MRKTSLERYLALRKTRRLRTFFAFGLIALGPVLAVATFLVLGPFAQGATSQSLRLILLTDILYIIIVAGLVLAGIMRMIAARRTESAGSRLHLRLTGVFAFIALSPTVLVAVFAMLTLNMGLEGWFSDRVRLVVGNSRAAAEAYKGESRDGLVQDARAIASFLSVERQRQFLLTEGELSQLLIQSQNRIQRGLSEAFVLNSDGEIRVRGNSSYLFNFDMPTPDQIAKALSGETVVIEDWAQNEFRVLLQLQGFTDHLLYLTREVNGEILDLVDETQEAARLYNQLESQRGQRLFQFGLIYLGFALILILAAVWMGMWFAERLARPVGRLAGAAKRVGAGDLDVQVLEERGDDEIAMLGRYFNQMTKQLKGQRARLLENTHQIDERRRLFDSVLSSVTGGVIGLNALGRVTFLNRAAEQLLEVRDETGQEHELSLVVPEFQPMYDDLSRSSRESVQQEVRLARDGKQESLLVRIAKRRNEDGELEGYVLAFDDVTDLVSAQRMAAWGDVARRIAHEIKNPLTPIQLSAERIKRKFSKVEGLDVAALEQYTDVIVRQTGDLRRIVDEFSKFARMPEPERRRTDIVALTRDAVLLQQAGQEGVSIRAQLPDGEVLVDIDATMIGQALTNLIKNAGEAIETLQERGAPEGHNPEVRIEMTCREGGVRITIADNGIGLPEDRSRLFEPYVTTRDKGTGLGLPIVKKIIEEHGGTLLLDDAPAFGENALPGAMAIIWLPVDTPPDAQNV
ncbi:sensor histidine kinase NtrY-like [Aliiroseovarius lamellibrachiae]|uniref:sensor histidine kinase NtrY-like n=1 Tax=Aliiroseovarius lamellibrachiae TaxID=1924933 RepID=UPI001BE0FBD4|nr:PAS domain-containing sensor histidine kinase [Aliiroseovarius lamellibrachiae]MBT2132029.1 PAS domain-containing sensor histidine kinase [Aliiroseovarius lamellibrachiae]